MVSSLFSWLLDQAKGLPKIDHFIKQQLNLHETSDAADADAAKD